GIDLDHVASVERTAEEARGARVAILPARPAIQLCAVGEIVAAVDEDRLLVELGLAVPGVEAVDGELARIVRAIDQRILLAEVVTFAFGAVLVLVFRPDGEEAVLTERQALPRGDH